MLRNSALILFSYLITTGLETGVFLRTSLLQLIVNFTTLCCHKDLKKKKSMVGVPQGFILGVPLFVLIF